MRTVYGPVPSWRFGVSLGIDVIAGPKTCTFDCIYCQLGRTEVCREALLSRDECVKPEDVERCLLDYLDRVETESLDVVTFSGRGEPTLNPMLGEIAEVVRSVLGSRIPLVLLTNSSLLHLSTVREGARSFDVVCAKLDAGDDRTHKLINRPCGGGRGVGAIVESLRSFAEEFSGDFMVQTMFLRTSYGLTNCEGEAFEKLVEAIARISPRVVQVDTPYRPGGEEFVLPLDLEELGRVGRELEARLPRCEIWTLGVHDRRKRARWKSRGELVELCLELLERRPCRPLDVADGLGIDVRTSIELLKSLEEDSLIEKREVRGEVYYSVKRWRNARSSRRA